MLEINVTTMFALFLSAFAVHIWNFNKLVRLEYHSYREQWEKDSKPCGYFWYPPETSMPNGWLVRVDSTQARWRLYHEWMHSTPEWVKYDQQAIAWIGWYRASFIVGLVSVVVTPLCLTALCTSFSGG